MHDFDDTTLWHVSDFDRGLKTTGSSGFARLDGPTVLPTTLLADLNRLAADAGNNDVLEVVAACIRHRQSALLCLRYLDVVWPVTLFPNHAVYHSPHDLARASQAGLASLQVMAAEPAGVHPPDHTSVRGSGHADHYRALNPLLWSLALQGPRRMLLAEIAGTAAYRALRTPATQTSGVSGALQSAIQRLSQSAAPLREIGSWPGMSVERGARLLNGLYLTASLIVSRTHPAARG